jgi:hypothetical protein
VSGLTLEAAEEAARKAARERAGKPAYYHPSSEKPVPSPSSKSDEETEPSDPERVDHESRRQTRLAYPSYDVQNLPKPLVECGCGECPDYYDPLYDDARFGNYYAQEECPNPQPMTLKQAREAYLVYQVASHNADDRTSTLERTRIKHGKLLGAGRDIYQRFEDVTQIFLSLRLSPISSSGYWLEPVKLDNRLHGSWANVRDVLSYHLQSYDSEYVTITATTTSAATPHRHVLVYVDDPDDEVPVDVAKAAVDSHVRNTTGAFADDHPVKPGERDAGMVLHDPPKANEVPNDTWLHVAEHWGHEPFPVTTATMQYVANQRPHWSLASFCDDDKTGDPQSIELEGGAIAWAASHNWLTSSKGFEM